MDLLKEILKRHNFSDEEIKTLYNIVKEIARDEAEDVKYDILYNTNERI